MIVGVVGPLLAAHQNWKSVINVLRPFHLKVCPNYWSFYLETTILTQVAVIRTHFLLSPFIKIEVKRGRMEVPHYVPRQLGAPMKQIVPACSCYLANDLGIISATRYSKCSVAYYRTFLILVALLCLVRSIEYTLGIWTAFRTRNRISDITETVGAEWFQKADSFLDLSLYTERFTNSTYCLGIPAS